MFKDEHELMVEAFLHEKKEEDPDMYEEICKKYPVQNEARERVVRRRERSLEELPHDMAYRHNIDPKYKIEDEG